MACPQGKCFKDMKYMHCCSFKCQMPSNFCLFFFSFLTNAFRWFKNILCRIYTCYLWEDLAESLRIWFSVHNTKTVMLQSALGNVQLCPGQHSGWLCLTCGSPSVSPFLGRSTSRLQGASSLSHPSRCRDTGRWGGGRLCPSLKYTFGKVSIGRRRFMKKEADSLTCQCHPSVCLFKLGLREVIRWPPPVQVSRHFLVLQVCVKGWRKLALPQSSFSPSLAISERSEHDGKVRVLFKMFLLCRGVVFLLFFLKKSLVCQRDEARREMSLWWLRIIVLKALFKPLLTKLKHLACGACVPTFSLKGMCEDGRLPGCSGGGKACCDLLGCCGFHSHCLHCTWSMGWGRGRKPFSWAWLYAKDVLLR